MIRLYRPRIITPWASLLKILWPYGQLLVPVFTGNLHSAQSDLTLRNPLNNKLLTTVSLSNLQHEQGSKYVEI